MGQDEERQLTPERTVEVAEQPVSGSSFDEQRERQAVAAIAEALVESAETGATAIAEKYLATIPERDREISDQRQLANILQVFHLETLSTEDKIQGISRQLDLAVAKFVQEKENRYRMFEKGELYNVQTREMRRIAEDPGRDGTVDPIADSNLPESVKNALIRILQIEGPNPPAQLYEELATELEQRAAGEPSDNATADMWNYIKAGHNAFGRDRINFTFKAVWHFVKSLYPKLAETQSFELYADIASEPADEKSLLYLVDKMVTYLGDNKTRGFEAPAWRNKWSGDPLRRWANSIDELRNRLQTERFHPDDLRFIKNHLKSIVYKDIKIPEEGHV